jgi:hypothetical protein
MKTKCPAGKIECDHFVLPFICRAMNYWAAGNSVEHFEVCPWPSRQKRQPTAIEQVAAEIATMPHDEFKANLEKLKKLAPQKYDEFENKQFLKGYAKGAERMKRRCIERIKRVKDWYNKCINLEPQTKNVIVEILAAIEAVEVNDDK